MAQDRGKHCSALRSFRVVLECVAAHQKLTEDLDAARIADAARQGPEALVEQQVQMAMDFIRQRPAVFREAARRLNLEIRPLDEDAA